jgi:DNA-binding transcriptional LysR family regulator
VTLTDAGRKLHDYARRILDLTATARADMTGTPATTAGDLVLAASSIPGHHLLPPALAAYRVRHPSVRVRVSVSDTDAVFADVEHSRAHLGFVGGPGGGPHLEFRPLAGDELVLVVPKGHPWSRKRRVSGAALAAQPLVQRERGSGSRHCLERAGRTAAGLNVVLELDSNEAVKAAVVAGLGVAVVSRRALQADVGAGRLAALTVEGLSLSRDLFIVRVRRRVLPTPAHLFMRIATAGPHRPPAA